MHSNVYHSIFHYAYFVTFAQLQMLHNHWEAARSRSPCDWGGGRPATEVWRVPNYMNDVNMLEML